MRLRQSLAVSVALIAATMAVAHQGVKDPAVKARMDSMVEIAEATKVIGLMASGARPFDGAAAAEAAREIAAHGARMPALFEVPAEDPASEALPAIWEEFEDFTARAAEMERAALAAADVRAPAEASAALAALGETCKSCHSRYRE